MSRFAPPETTQRSILAKSVIDGHSYRVSSRVQLDNGQEFTVDIDPDTDALYIETPVIEAEGRANVDVWENASVADGGTATDDLTIHNMKYDETDQPNATIQRINDGDTDTATADKTEETLVQSGGTFGGTANAAARGFWRIIPADMRVTIIVTDQSGGNGNWFAFDTVVHEGVGLV